MKDILRRAIFVVAFIGVALMFGALNVPAVQDAAKVEQLKPKADEKMPMQPASTQIKTWQMPAHMMEALTLVLNQKVEEYKAVLRGQMKGYEEMPDNVVFDFRSGLFIRAEDWAKIQAAQQAEAQKQKEAAAPAKK